MNNLVSIIIPLHNREELIVETLQSLLNQTYRYWEAIVVDDGSTDNSYNVVNEISENEPRIKLHKRNRLPKGAPTCRNIGIDKSKGSYLMFLDSDDLLTDFCLQNRLNKFSLYPNMDFIVFLTLLFKRKPNDTNILWNTPKPDNYLLRFFRLEPPWALHSVLWRKETLKTGLQHDELLLSFQDWDLHINAILKNLNFKYFSEHDTYCRVPTSHKTIGKESLSLQHLKSHEYLFFKIKNNLKYSEYNKDKKLKVAMSALFFWLEKQFLLKGYRKKAIIIRLKQLSIPLLAYDFIIISHHILYKKKIPYIQKIFRKILPNIYFAHFGYTFRNTLYESSTNKHTR